MSMSKSNIAIIVLAITLIASNGLWVYASSFGKEPLRSPSKCEPSEAIAEVYDEAVLPLEAAIAESASPRASRDSIVRAASQSKRGDGLSVCQEDDLVRVRGIQLKFDQAGKLIGAATGICVP